MRWIAGMKTGIITVNALKWVRINSIILFFIFLLKFLYFLIQNKRGGVKQEKYNIHQ